MDNRYLSGKIFLYASIMSFVSFSSQAMDLESKKENKIISSHYNSYQQQIQSGVTSKEFEKYEQFTESYISERMKYSTKKSESFSWLFSDNFQENYLNPVKGILRNSIKELGNKFFENLHTLKSSDSMWIAHYENFLKNNNFLDISNFQLEFNHQYVFIHQSGLMVRLKANPNLEPQLCLSLYKENGVKAIQNYFKAIEDDKKCNDYDSYNDLKDACIKLENTIDQKQGSESCKLYFNVINDKLIINPVPNAPYAVLSLDTVFKENKCKLDLKKLNNTQKLTLQNQLITTVMNFGHQKAKVCFKTPLWEPTYKDFYENSFEKYGIISEDFNLSENNFNFYGSMSNSNNDNMIEE